MMQTDADMLTSTHQSIRGPYTSSTTVTTISDNIMHDDDVLSDDPSSPDSSFDATELMQHEVHQDEVTTQLAASGPIGVAAAAAISSYRKRRRPHQFETNPATRKRQHTRLLRKLKATIEEYTTRVGQQAVLLAVTPAKGRDGNQTYKVFGSQPLENVVRNCRGVIMQELEQVLAQQAPPPPENSHLFELPPLVIDGMPTSLEKMTQAQLRMFIPEMLKYSTGRSKPGWGKPECRPVWWPNDVPWANVRCDARSEQEKKRVSWTLALRSIIRNCYKHHGREDLLPTFDESPVTQHQFNTVMQTINNPDGTLSIIQVDTGSSQLSLSGSQVVTLADGTQATVVQALTTEELEEGPSDDDMNQHLTHVTEATLAHDGSLILADGTSLTHDNGMVQIPVSMYNGAVMVGSVSQLDGQSLAIISPPKSESDVPPSTQTVEIISAP